MTKCTLKEMEYQQDYVAIQVIIPAEKVVENTQLNLMLIERQTEKELSFPLQKISSIDQAIIMEGKIPNSKYHDLLTMGDHWDFYVGYSRAEEQVKHRVRSSDKALELLYIKDETLNKMLVPYSTNKHNFSLQTKELGIIAGIETISLEETGVVKIVGYALDTSNNEVTERSLILRGNNGEFEHRLKLKNIVRKDLTEQYGRNIYSFDNIGFEAEYNLTWLFNHLEDKTNFRLYVEMKLSDNGKEIIKESTPIKYPLVDKYASQKYVFKWNNSKKKIHIGRSKKAKYVSLSIGDYHFKEEIKSKVKRNFLKMKRHSFTKKVYKQLFKCLGMLPAKKKLVMFESFLGKQYSDNPRAIYEYLKANYPDYKMYWSVDKKFIQNFKGKDLHVIKRFSVKWLFTMPRARFWVTNSRMPLWIPKPRHTVYLQTWHGTPLKRLAADMDEVHMPGTTTQKYKENFLTEASNWDYLVSPNGYSTEIFRRAFQFHKEMIESGYPRNDFLFQSNRPEEIRKIKETYGIPLDKKIILYAPTWRDDQFYGKGKYKFDLDLDLDQLRNKMGDDYIVILRMHYLVAENFDLSPYTGFAFDFSNHEDIRELYLISDILITDYSSVFFDYANLKRPMIFYVYDIDTYRDKLRGFYFDFEKHAPGPLVKTTEEVINTIRDMEAQGFQLPPSFEPFHQKFCYLESGNSSKKVVERVFLGRNN